MSTVYALFGRNFKSLKQISDFYSVSYSAVIRISKKPNFSIKDLETYILNQKHGKSDKSYLCYNIKFRSKYDMCRQLHADYYSFCKNINSILDLNNLIISRLLALGYIHSFVAFSDFELVYIIYDANTDIFTLKQNTFKELFKVIIAGNSSKANGVKYNCPFYNSDGVFYLSVKDYNNKGRQLSKYPVYENGTLSVRKFIKNSLKCPLTVFGVKYESIKDASEKLNIPLHVLSRLPEEIKNDENKLNDIVSSYIASREERVLKVKNKNKDKKQDLNITILGNVFESLQKASEVLDPSADISLFIKDNYVDEESLIKHLTYGYLYRNIWGKSVRNLVQNLLKESYTKGRELAMRNIISDYLKIPISENNNLSDLSDCKKLHEYLTKVKMEEICYKGKYYPNKMEFFRDILDRNPTGTDLKTVKLLQKRLANKEITQEELELEIDKCIAGSNQRISKNFSMRYMGKTYDNARSLTRSILQDLYTDGRSSYIKAIYSSSNSQEEFDQKASDYFRKIKEGLTDSYSRSKKKVCYKGQSFSSISVFTRYLLKEYSNRKREAYIGSLIRNFGNDEEELVKRINSYVISTYVKELGLSITYNFEYEVGSVCYYSVEYYNDGNKYDEIMSYEELIRLLENSKQ